MVTRVTAVAAEVVVLVAASDIESVIERLQQCQLAGATVTMQTQETHPPRQSQAVANAQAKRAVAAHGLLQATPTVGAPAQPAPALQIAPARTASPRVGDPKSTILSVWDPSRSFGFAPNATRAPRDAVCASLDADSQTRMTHNTVRRLLARPSIILSPLQIEMRHYYAAFRNPLAL